MTNVKLDHDKANIVMPPDFDRLMTIESELSVEVMAKLCGCIHVTADELRYSWFKALSCRSMFYHIETGSDWIEPILDPTLRTAAEIYKEKSYESELTEEQLSSLTENDKEHIYTVILMSAYDHAQIICPTPKIANMILSNNRDYMDIDSPVFKLLLFIIMKKRVCARMGYNPHDYGSVTESLMNDSDDDSDDDYQTNKDKSDASSIRSQVMMLNALKKSLQDKEMQKMLADEVNRVIRARGATQSDYNQTISSPGDVTVYTDDNAFNLSINQNKEKNSKPFECITCDKCFKDKYALRRHERTDVHKRKVDSQG